MIKLENIDYSYEDDYALQNMSMQVNKNEKIVLLGNNGSGKSTLLKIMAGLYFPSKGKYLYNDLHINKKSAKKEFRKKVGILFQNPESMIFNPTVFDEIAFSLKEFDFDNIQERVHKISKEFGIEHLLQKSPLDLSGGEKQKVMLCAILVYNPELILLDEPTASMDPKTTGWFVDFISELEKNVVIATHDLSIAYEVSQRAIAINEHHKKIFDGDIDELFGNIDLLLEANLIHEHKHKHKKVNFSKSNYHLHF